jgi:hypothetical protein
MLSISSLRRILDKHDATQRAYLERYYRMNTKAANVYLRFPPVTSKELAAAKEYWRRTYPASYRTFLDINNGWRRFGLGWSLVGAPTSQNKDMYKDVKNTLRQLSTVASQEEQTELVQKQKKDPKLILSTEQIVLGTDFNGGLLLFDSNRVSASKEPQVVSVQSVIHVVDRWTNFEAFVRDIASRVERRLEKTLASDEEAAAGKRPTAKRASSSTSRPRRR